MVLGQASGSCEKGTLRALCWIGDGSEWRLEGQLVEKEYWITAGADRVAPINQKWVTVRDSYSLDLAPDADPGFALAVLWAVDRWVERN